MIAFMFGAWKKPNPMPQIMIRQTMSGMLGLAGSNASSAMPRPSSTSPMPPNNPTAWRSERRPAIGAMMPTTSGHGVMKKPVSTCERPSTSSK
jgi:hypothetical protein